MLVLIIIVHRPGYFTIHYSNRGKIVFLSMGQKYGFPSVRAFDMFCMLSYYFQESEI